MFISIKFSGDFTDCTVALGRGEGVVNGLLAPHTLSKALLSPQLQELVPCLPGIPCGSPRQPGPWGRRVSGLPGPARGGSGWDAGCSRAPAAPARPLWHRPVRPAGGRLRLVGGPSPCRGRVEVLYAGGWGTVCDDDWDFADARVACREAGCGPALGATGLGHFGYGRGPVLLDNVGCTGTEARLSDCFHLGWGQHNCGHHEDAGALCAGEAAAGGVESEAEWAGPSAGAVSDMGGARASGARSEDARTGIRACARPQYGRSSVWGGAWGPQSLVGVAS